MTGLLVDVQRSTVKIVNVSGLQDYYRLIGCTTVVNIPLRRSRLSGKMETTCPDRRKPL